MQIELRAERAEDTRAIGEALAPFLRAGDTLALTGDLGAGKTTFTQGLARGLGFSGPVVSPTFTLVREYRGGRLAVVHADVYRLERVQDVIDLGLDDTLAEGDAVLVVEWGDAVEALLPKGHVVLELTIDADSDARRIVLRDSGAGWHERWERLEQAIEPWSAR
jgi:tRNA threonylcarbamoyladenosine biosynthesis protein TsaE